MNIHEAVLSGQQFKRRCSQKWLEVAWISGYMGFGIVRGVCYFGTEKEYKLTIDDLEAVNWEVANDAAKERDELLRMKRKR